MARVVSPKPHEVPPAFCIRTCVPAVLRGRARPDLIVIWDASLVATCRSGPKSGEGPLATIA